MLRKRVGPHAAVLSSLLSLVSWCRVVWCRGCGWFVAVDVVVVIVAGSVIVVVIVACVSSVQTLSNQACVIFIAPRLVGSMVVWFVVWLAVWLVRWFVGCLVGRLFRWLGVLLVGWWFVSWLAGWLESD